MEVDSREAEVQSPVQVSSTQASALVPNAQYETLRPSLAAGLTQLAIVRYTLRIVWRSLLAVFITSLFVDLSLHLIEVPNNLWGNVVDAFLVTVVVLPILYPMLLRPVARMTAEQAAAAAEARFQAVAHSTQDGILVFDADGIIRFANRAAEQVYGYPSGLLAGHAIEHLIPEWGRSHFRDDLAGYLSSQKSEVIGKGCHEKTALRPDGSIRDIEFSVDCVGTGKGVSFVVILRDITARKQVERERIERTARLNALVESNPLAIVMVDPNGRVQICNAAFEQLFRYRETNIRGRHLDELVASSEMFDEAIGFTERNLRGEAVHTITRRLRSDGTQVDVELHAVPLLVGGEMLGSFGIYQDLTERRHLENAARESEVRFRDLFERANDAILVVDPASKKILQANPKACELYGYMRSELLGMNFHSIAKNTADTDERFAQLLHQRSAMDFETVHLDNGGRQMILHVSASTIEWRGGKAILSISRDVTAQKKAEDMLRENEKKFREMLAALPVAVRIVQDDRVVFVNPADARLHGFTGPAEELNSRVPSQVVPEDSARMSEFVRGIAAGERISRYAETQRVRSDGSRFPASVNARRILYEDKPAAILVIQDLTERTKLQMYEQLLPVCCVCGKIRDDAGTAPGQGPWDRLDRYIARHTDAKLSHTFCPECELEYRKREGLV